MGDGGRGLNRQNLLSMTKVICCNQVNIRSMVLKLKQPSKDPCFGQKVSPI